MILRTDYAHRSEDRYARSGYTMTVAVVGFSLVLAASAVV
jgi:hypothetical protein